MKNLFKNPKTRTRNLLLLIAPFLIVMIVCGFISFKSIKSMTSNTSGTAVVYKDSIDEMDYHLRSNATDLQEDLFHELQDAITDGTDNGKIALLVCENFVADFYTWTNKDGTYDIGGMYYVYSPQKSNIYNNARNNYYKYLNYYIDTYGSDNLLEVESIDEEKVSVSEKLSYEFEGKTYESYYCEVGWNYKNLETFSDISTPTMDGESVGFVNFERFQVIVNDDGRFEIVQAYGAD